MFFQSKPGKRVPEDASAAWLEGEISDLIENNLNEFLTVAEDKEYHNKVFIYNAVAKKAIIRREGRYLTPEGELIASSNMAKAATTLAKAPGALHLRTLQSINDVSSDQSNTIIFTVPLEILKAYVGDKK